METVPHQPTFLVINRISTLRRITVQALSFIGFSQVREFASLHEAEPALQTPPPNPFLILEFTSTQFIVEELSFLKRLRATRAGADMPIIVTTQNVDKDLIVALARERVRNIILKNSDAPQLAKKLNAAYSNLTTQAVAVKAA